jgi:uncharacterized protein with beta-barrel porin domain
MVPLLRLERLNPNGEFARLGSDDFTADSLFIGGQPVSGVDYEWWRGGADQPVGNVLMLDLSDTGLSFADDQLLYGGHALTSATAMALEDTGWRHIQNRARRDFIYRRQEALSDEADPSHRWVWVEPFFSRARQKPGGGRSRLNTSGITFGVEGYNDKTLAGVAFSLGLPSYRAETLKNDAEMYTLGAYGSFRNPEFLNLGWNFGHTWIFHDQGRTLGGHRYEADYRGRVWRAGFDLSRPMETGEGFILSPRLGYDFIRLETSAYRETFDEVFALKMGRNRQHLHQISLGAELYWALEGGRGLTVGAAWVRRSGDLRGSVVSFFQGDPFNRPHQAVAHALDKNLAEVGLRLDIPLGKNLNLDLKYGGVYSAHTQTHGGQAMFSFRF